MLTVRKAKKEDLDVIMAIYEIGRKFMREHGNPTQWAGGYPPREMIVEDIAVGRSIVICEDARICGVFALFDAADPTYLRIDGGAWLNDEPYLTIHRIASDGTTRGVLKCAVDYCKSLSDNVRIDTHEDNHVMQAAVEKNGFKRCGIIYLENGDPRIAYHWSAEG
jgi:RimJ/RimL family protein N-acetyltransferase